MPDLVILPAPDLTAGQRPAQELNWRRHGNPFRTRDDPKDNRGRVRFPRRLRERPDLELRNCRDEEDFSRPVGVGTTYRQIRSIPGRSEDGFKVTAFKPYETRDASGLSLMMRLKTSLPRALAVTFFVLT